MKTNYHSHTYYCGHSSNELEPLILKAIDNGYEKFGISEHIPLLNNHIRKPKLNDFYELINKVNELKIKYKNKIEIYMGVECEYYEDGKLDKWVKEVARIDGIDYLNFGNHFYDSCFEKFTYYHHYSKKEIIDRYKQIGDMAMKSKLFVAYNHPDIFIRDVGEWNADCEKLTKHIIKNSIKYDIPLEFNLNGLALRYDIDKLIKHFEINDINDWKKISRKKITNVIEENFLDITKINIYPVPQFWQCIKDTKAKINIGIDTHSLVLMNDHYYQLALHLLKEWGLAKNIVYDLNIKK